MTLEVGGAMARVQLDAKGRGVSANGKVKLASNKKTGAWTLTGRLKGDLKAPWEKYGITGDTVINAAVNFPVLLILESATVESFAAEAPLTYNNKSGTSGTATYVPVR